VSTPTEDRSTASLVRSPVVLALVAASVVGPMDVPLVSPALPAARDALVLTDAQAGFIVTAFALPGVVVGPLLGMFADRFGRTRILVGCLVVYGLAGGAIAVAGSFDTILVLRFLQGTTGGSILSILTFALVGDYYEGTTRNAVMGITTAGISVSVAVYPLVGGLLASVHWRVPFLLYLVSVPVAVLVAVVLEEPDTEPSGIGVGYVREALSVVAPVRALALYAAVLGSYVLLFGAVLTAVPFLLSGDYGLGSSGIGVVVALSMLVTAAVAAANGRLAARYGEDALLAAGFVAYGAGLVGVRFAPGAEYVAAALLLFGVGHGLELPTLASAISDLVPGRFRAGAMSLRTSMLVTGQAAGSALFPVLGARVGYRPVLLVAGGVAVAAGAVALVVTADRRSE
jgi:MFS family permease